MEATTLIFFLGAILIVGGLLFLVITLTKNVRTLDQDKFRAKWLKINNDLTKENAQSHKLAVLEADKLLDHALKDAGYKGETMGERMKNAKDTWTNASSVWGAHKLRNQIAHEHIDVSYDQARRALAAFKQALKDVGAI